MSGGFFDFHEQMNRRPGTPPRPATSGSTGQASEAPKPISVTDLTRRITRVLTSQIPETLHVQGELSNFRPHPSSGHLYFTLKDAENCIDCIMWQSDAARLKFTPQHGMELVASGQVAVYGKQGKYQLRVASLRPLGKGALELAFQQLRKKLEAAGLFAPERKKKLPLYPRTIALVTGANTAALQDMLKVLRPYPAIRVLLYAVPVQGDAAAPRIAEALLHLSQHGASLGIEAILLGRGGGSLEDLWPFNEEAVARAMATCSIPIVTGIGHEVDVSIADLVADYHAHTPTEAARVLTGHWAAAWERVSVVNQRLARAIRTILTHNRQRLTQIERHEAFRRPMDRIQSLRQTLDHHEQTLSMQMGKRLSDGAAKLLRLGNRLELIIPARLARLGHRLEQIRQGMLAALSSRLRSSNRRLATVAERLGDSNPKHKLPARRQKFEALAERLQRAMTADLRARGAKLEAVSRQLQAVGPENVLRRGYTITTRKRDGAIVRSTSDLKTGDAILTRVSDGQIESTVGDQRQMKLFE